MKRASQVLFLLISCLFTHSLFAEDTYDGSDFEQYAANQPASEIQGTDAGGGKQMTVIDANGNLKIMGGPGERSETTPVEAPLSNKAADGPGPTTLPPQPPVKNEEIKPSSDMPGPNANTSHAATSPATATPAAALSPAQSATTAGPQPNASPGQKQVAQPDAKSTVSPLSPAQTTMLPAQTTTTNNATTPASAHPAPVMRNPAPGNPAPVTGNPAPVMRNPAPADKGMPIGAASHASSPNSHEAQVKSAQNLQETTGLMPKNPHGIQVNALSNANQPVNQPKPVIITPRNASKVFNPHS